MAKDPSKTEKPTPKRIRDARREGNVISSQDVTALVSILGGAGFMIFLVPRVEDAYVHAFRNVMHVDCSQAWTIPQVREGLLSAVGLLSPIIAPLLIGSVAFAAVGRLVQVGPYFDVKPLTWRLSSLNPASGAKQVMPTGQNVTKLLLVLSKIGIIGLMSYVCVRKDLPAITQLPLLTLEDGVAWSLHHGYMLMLKVLGIFLFVTAVDYALKRRKYFEDLKMSRQEIKDETKNTEGDPHIRGRMRQRMRELTRLRLIAEVPNADVVVVNPTHVAVALRYKPGSWAPRIVAKGLRKRALRIRRMAADSGVPVVREPATARALYRHGQVGQYIPDHLFGAVAVILARLERLGARRFSETATPAAERTATTT